MVIRYLHRKLYWSFFRYMKSNKMLNCMGTVLLLSITISFCNEN
jgi:hypothetical protein